MSGRDVTDRINAGDFDPNDREPFDPGPDPYGAPPPPEPQPDPFDGQWLTVRERMGSVDWFSEQPPKRRWLLKQNSPDADGFLPRGKVGMLAAAGGSGKTQALLQLALSVALPREAHERKTDQFGWFAREQPGGRGWRAPYRVADGGRVLCILGEEDEEEIRRRLWKTAKGYGLAGELDRANPDLTRWRMAALDRLLVIPGAGNTRLALTSGAFADGGTDSTAATHALIDRMNNSGDDWALVILDPLSRFAAGDSETDNREATALVQAAEMLCKVNGNPSVLLAHHTSQATRKDDSEALSSYAARGVTALTDGIRWQANMAPMKRIKDAPALVRFGMSKTNYTKWAPAVELAWTREGTLGLALPTEQKKWNKARDTEKAEQAEKRKKKPAKGSAGDGRGFGED